MFRYDVINPNEPGVQRVQYPVNASWLKDVALRDLRLHERHAACVDARGDVYQWGDGFFGSNPTSKSEPQGPKLTLRGHVRRLVCPLRRHRYSVCDLVRTSSSFSSPNLEYMLYRPRGKYMSSRLMQNNKKCHRRSHFLLVLRPGGDPGYGERKEMLLTSRKLHLSRNLVGVNSLYQPAIRDHELIPT